MRFVCKLAWNAVLIVLPFPVLNDFSVEAIDPPAPLSNGHHYFAEYSTAELTCIAPDGVPQPVVWWEGPQGHTLTVPAHTVESILILTRVLAEDAGQYTCWAMNSVRKVSTKTTVVVTSKRDHISAFSWHCSVSLSPFSGPPVIQQHPMSASVNEDEEASMSCTFAGIPAPGSSVKWLKDGKQVPEHFKSRTGTLNGTLTFESASRKHAGSYACQVETIGHHPVVSHTATLHVRGIIVSSLVYAALLKTVIDLDKLKFTILPVTKTLELGTSRKVLCKAQGNPIPVVHWMKEGEPMMNLPDHVEDVNGTLFFNGVRHEDEGRYTCVATNSQGLISASVYINVTRKRYDAFFNEAVVIDVSVRCQCPHSSSRCRKTLPLRSSGKNWSSTAWRKAIRCPRFSGTKTPSWTVSPANGERVSPGRECVETGTHKRASLLIVAGSPCTRTARWPLRTSSKRTKAITAARRATRAVSGAPSSDSSSEVRLIDNR